MRLQQWGWLVWGCGIVLITQGSWAAENLVVSVDHASPPFMYEQNGQAMGIYPAIITAAFAAVGQAVEVHARPWARVLSEVDHEGVGGGGAVKTAERELKYDFSDPFYQETHVIFFSSVKPIAYKTMDDLTGLTVGIIRGASYNADFVAARQAQKFVVEEVTTSEQNFKKLNAGRIDAFVDISEQSKLILQRADYPNVVMSDQPFATFSIHLIFAKSAKQTDALELFNRGLAQLKQDGRYQQIIASELHRFSVK